MNFTPVMIRQIFPKECLADIQSSVAGELKKTDFPQKFRKGMKVAILVGSRGIANLVEIVRALVRLVKQAEGEPFVVAAMGSHGGGTAGGQREVLKHLGITETSVGCKVCCNSDCVMLGSTAEGYPVYISRGVLSFDGILVLNRVKPHTAFKGEIESGLMKMLAVGLGGPEGASAVHSGGARGLRLMIPSIAREVMKLLPVWGGLAVVENAYEEIFLISGTGSKGLEENDRKMLVMAKKLMPSLPFQEIDVLVVEELGKNFSGTGMDSNVIGRMRIQGEPEPKTPCIKRIVALDLSEASKGNATGIGLADFTTKALVKKIDYQATYFNCLTSTFIQRAMIPMTLDHEDEAIEAALKSLGNVPKDRARVVRIANTLDLERLWISRNLVEEADANPLLELAE